MNWSPVEPAVRCLACEYSWRSRAMAEGLAELGSCPRCGGQLAFRQPAGSAPAIDEPSTPLDQLAPHRVLGLPRW